jgi:hypothetical protein
MEEKKKVLVEYNAFSVYDLEGPIDSVINTLKKHKAACRKLGAAPDEAKLCVVYSGDEGYYITLAYSRPETKQETKDRVAREEDHRNAIKQRELQQLKLLKAKYEGE